jgi:sugar phosphate isomerase/epimerase
VAPNGCKAKTNDTMQNTSNPKQSAVVPVNLVNRRRFMAGALTSAAATACARAPGNAAGAAEIARTTTTRDVSPKFRVSILSYSFRGLLNAGMMDVFGYLESCKYCYGLDTADIWNGFLTSTEPAYLRQVRAALDERELTLADLCVDEAHVWDDDPAVREKNYENARAHLRAAEILGARFMRVDTGGRGATWIGGQFDFVVKRYGEYAQFAHDHGFKVGAENHWGPEASWPNLKRLHAAVNHPAFGLSIHLGGWTGTEEQKVAWDREAAPLACHTHIAWNITQDNLEERLAPFYRAGYSGSYSVEHHSGKDEYQNVAIQLARVREALQKLAGAERRS